MNARDMARKINDFGLCVPTFLSTTLILAVAELQPRRKRSEAWPFKKHFDTIELIFGQEVTNSIENSFNGGSGT